MKKKVLTPKDLLLARDLSPKVANQILRRYGFEDPRLADANLQLIGREPDQRRAFSEIVTPLLESVSETPDPDMALNNLERFCEAIIDRRFLFSLLGSDSRILGLLVGVFGSSPFLSDILIRNPGYFWWLIEEGAPFKEGSDREELVDELRRNVLALPDYETRLKALRRFKRRETLRIGIKDLLLEAEVAQVTKELSDLADAILQVSYEVCKEELNGKCGIPQYGPEEGKTKESGFAIISMGKLGGEELNFSSDIDLLFVYEKEGETSGVSRNGEQTGRISNHLYFINFSEMILKAVGEMTDEDYCYRVDMRLRPEGKMGALARSLYSYELYYESWGETWERQALLKARFSAGNERVGNRFIQMIQPFIYRKYLDYAAISEIRHMKERIDQKIGAKGEYYQHVKLGYGGIREIEFIVQAYQLIYGNQRPDIRERNTLHALNGLKKFGYIKKEEYPFLTEAYKLFRRVEHRLQIVHERQIHTLPSDERELEKLARRLGFRGAKASREFLRVYKRYTSEVRNIYEDLFYSPTEAEAVKMPEEVNLILDSDTDPERVNKLLKKYRFKDTNQAHRNLVLINSEKGHVPLSPKGRLLLANIISGLLKAVGESSDPDLSLSNMERFFSKTSVKEVYFKVIAERPQIGNLLTTLFGGSEFLSNILIQCPELFDVLLAGEGMMTKKTKGEMIKELRSGQTGFNDKLNIIRKYKKGEVLRVGTGDLLGFSDFPSISSQLSDLADAILQVVLETCYPRQMRFAIFSLGKLGGREISYGSDLDIIFVYKDGNREQEYFSKVAENVLQALTEITEEGELYKVDTRLRPFGRAGTLAISMEAYQRYFREWVQTWERQALTKARFVAGDTEIGKRFLRKVHDYIYRSPIPYEAVKEIYDMRKRMEEELVRREETGYHIKLSSGGIVDIEFLVQLLQLRYGHKDRHLRGTNTLSILYALKEGGYISNKEHIRLVDSYLFLRGVENRLRIVHDVPMDLFPHTPDKVESLAKRLGYKEGRKESLIDRLIRDFDRHKREVWRIYERVFKREGLM